MNDLLLSMEVDSNLKKPQGQGYFIVIYHHSLLLNTSTHNITYRKAIRIH